MNTLTDIARWAFQTNLDWSCVIFGAILAAWLAYGGPRRPRPYDAWWFFNIGRRRGERG